MGERGGDPRPQLGSKEVPQGCRALDPAQDVVRRYLLVLADLVDVVDLEGAVELALDVDVDPRLVSG